MLEPIDLLLRADDAGSFQGTTRAIAEVAGFGLVKNVSVLAVGPELESAAAVLRNLPGVAVGLHACFTSEWKRPGWRPLLPADKVSTLVEPTGNFLADGGALLTAGAHPNQALLELEAQLARLHAVGLQPSYLDEHMGVAQVLGWQDHLRVFAGAHGLVYRPDVPSLFHDGLRHLEKSEAGVHTRLRGRTSSTFVLIGHPAYDDEEMSRVARCDGSPAGLGAAWDSERKLFLAPWLRELCRSGRCRSVRYDEL